MIYRGIETAPKDKKVDVVWGEKGTRPEYGVALKLGDQWYIYEQSNPYANGKPCAAPDGWLPENRNEWTKAETTLCDILVLFPNVAEWLSKAQKSTPSSNITSATRLSLIS